MGLRYAAMQAGIDARADMVLLTRILLHEAAEQRLSQPAVEPILDEAEQVTNQVEIDVDEAERASAQAVIAAADATVLDWVEQRRPVPVEEPVPA